MYYEAATSLLNSSYITKIPAAYSK
jgi:hypothetical protein